MSNKKKATNKRRPRHEAPVDNHTELEADIAESHETMAEAEAISDEAAEIMAESQEINTEAQNEGVSPEDGISYGSESADEKVHLEFIGSDIIRGKAPKIMEIADSVADQWQKDGEFKNLPVDNVLAQVLAEKALRKAKDVEKKLEEKGVFMMARIGLDYAKSKLKKKD
jgi:hypothetical protein